MIKKILFLLASLLIAATIVWCVFGREGKCVRVLDLRMRQPNEMETHVIRDCYGDGFIVQAQENHKRLYPASELKEEEIGAAISRASVKYGIGHEFTLSFRICASSPNAVKEIGSACRLTVERIVEKANRQLEDRNLAQLLNRVRKLGKKLSMKKGDLDLEIALTNALESVSFAQDHVSALKVDIVGASLHDPH